VSLKEIFKGRIKTKEKAKEILEKEIFLIEHHLEIEVLNVIIKDLMVIYWSRVNFAKKKKMN